MSSQPIVINIGALPNDGTGDPLRTAFNDVNLNFANVFAYGPVLSNIQIANNTILTTNTNGNLILNPNGIGVVQANAHVVPDSTRIRNLGSPALRWDTIYVQYANIGGSANITGNITAGSATFSGDLYVDGNLTVEGTTTTIDSTVVDIKDKNITLAFGSPNAQVANGGGITIAGANAQWYYNYPTNSWQSNITLTPPNIAFPDGSVLDTANTAHIGQTPLVKADGNLWFNSDDGRGYIKYNDQWIEFCPPVIPNPATYLGNLTIDGAENSTLYFPPGGAIVFGDDTVQTTAFNGNSIVEAAGNAGDIQINVAGTIGADSTLRYVNTGGEMTLYADYLNAPGIFTNDIYAGNGSPSNLTLTTSYGNASWTFGTDGNLVLPGGAGFVKGDSGQLKTNDGTTLALDFRDSSGRGFYTNSDGYTLRSNGSNNWVFGTNGNLTLPANGNISYAPGNAASWTSPAPTTIEEAIDRLAVVVNALNGGTGA